MIKHSAKFSAAAIDLSSRDGSKASEATAAIQFAYNGAEVPAGHDGASTIAEPSSHTDPLVASSDITDTSADVFNSNPDHIVGSVDLLVPGEAANTAIEIRSIEPQHSLGSSGAEFADLTGSIKSLADDANASLNGGLGEDRLASLFDHLEPLTQSLNNPGTGEAFNTPAEHVFNAPGPHLLDVPQGLSDAVISDARGAGGGGGAGHGGGGGSTPSPYTAHGANGVDIHITYDSSVGSAPTGFTSVVQHVADFFANAFIDATPITMNIAVGFGEVDGMRLGLGALGESVTNLQLVTASQLSDAYAGSGFSWGAVPNGNLYVSYAEAKALNIGITSPSSVDGWIGFSSRSGTFDYNNATASAAINTTSTAPWRTKCRRSWGGSCWSAG